MDGPHIAGDSPEADAASSSASASASASASSYGLASRRSRLRKGVRLQPRRWRVAAVTTRVGGGDSMQDLALPLGMSFAAVLAQVLNRNSVSGERLQPDFLSKMCTSAVKESLTNIYGDKFDNFMRNFEKSFGSTLRTLHLINETPVYEQSGPQYSYKHDHFVSENKLTGVDSESPIHKVQENTFSNSVDNRLILYSGVNQQLAHLSHSRSTPEFDQHILNAFERSLQEQARSNELKEFEIGLNVRKLQMRQSQLALTSYSHMLEKIKISMGFHKASFKEEKFKMQMQDTNHAKLLKTLIDLLVTAVIFMSLCFGYGTFIYSYQRITAVTAACTAATSRDSKSWWMPNSVSSFNSGLLFFRCHLLATTRLFFGIIMILAIAWLILQRSAMTGPNMPITFNCVLLGGLCGFAGRFCVDTLGGDGNVWLIFWEILCSIHLLGNSYPSLLYRILHGPISVSHGRKAVGLPYWARRYIFYSVLSLILPMLTGLLPFASLSDWMEHAIEQIKSAYTGRQIEA